VSRLITSLRRFLHWEPAPGCVLVLAAVAALVVMNSPAGPAYDAFWGQKAGLAVGLPHLQKMTVQLWVNDGLMALFFFLVGLEIKRELVKGELRDPRKTVLPIVAALGGMVAPACIYALMQPTGEASRGWPIPMATDIAFVVGILALFGHALPLGLKTFLLTLAIIDDLGAIVLIATLFTEHLSLVALGLVAAGLAAVAVCRAARVHWFAVYLILGLGVWLAFLESGVHPTIEGVLLGLLSSTSGNPSPLDRLEHALHPWVYFLIMPVFVLANAGVRVEAALLTHPVVFAAATGLVVGKPLGIVLTSRLAIALGLSRLPSEVDGKMLLGAGFLAGIGCTMSLFLAGLAFETMLEDASNIGILVGSTVSALLGSGVLVWAQKNNAHRT
jgi:NhaA family Na+:H+ antiporter